MKNIIFLLLTLATVVQLEAQTVIKGKITDSKKNPVNAASIRIKVSGKGVNADTAGHYIITTNEKGTHILQVSSVGYTTREIEIVLNDTTINLDIILKESAKQLRDVVVVSAGSFDASDKAKGASLTPMDAVTVAGNGGDISNSLRALPGTQQVGEREGLFVRGGTNEETRQFVDGTLLKNPNYPSVPGIIQPARLNPFLFKGILFNTGGYSALYGQALSSALILESIDLPAESEAGIHIFPTSMGLGFQKINRNKKSSYGANAQYGNTAFYNSIVPARQDFFRSPLYISADANFRIRTSETGILKFYTNYGYNHTGMRNPDIDSTTLLSSFETKGSNLYANLSYKETLPHKWKLETGLAYNYSTQHIITKLEDSMHKQLFIPVYPYNSKNRDNNIQSGFAQARIVATKMFNRNQAIRFGAEHFYNNDHYLSGDTVTDLTDNLTAAFAETDIYLTDNIAAKIGLRTEYSALLNKLNLAPRISFAYRFPDGGQINMAYGIFFQKPEWQWLLQRNSLAYAKASHYIINYQKKAHNRLVRIEAYYKKYDDLVTSLPEVANEGSGYAKGIELFFRDKKTFKDVDYWVSYTYLNTKRRFNNYPYLLQPDYATPHTMSIAVKRYFANLNLNVNLSYAFATGRPYYNIQPDGEGKPSVLNNGNTNMYNQVNMSFAYLFTLFPKTKHTVFSGIGMGVNNVLGAKSVFGYDYSANGLNRAPVTLPATRSYYIGIFMSLGIDRRDDFINNNL